MTFGFFGDSAKVKKWRLDFIRLWTVFFWGLIGQAACAESSFSGDFHISPLEIVLHESGASVHRKYLPPTPQGSSLIQANGIELTLLDDYYARKIAQHYGYKFQLDTNYLLEIIEYAVSAGKAHNISPFVIIAIIAHESNFQNGVRNKSGAEGLMQIMTKVHKKRFERYGGVSKAYVPEVNIKVGAAILSDCIRLTKSIRNGLRCYAGTLKNNDNGFVNFIFHEVAMLKKLAAKPVGDL